MTQNQQAYNQPYPKQAPWFIYGAYCVPFHGWGCGWTCKSGQLDMLDKLVETEAEAEAIFKANDHGLEHSNATA